MAQSMQMRMFAAVALLMLVYLAGFPRSLVRESMSPKTAKRIAAALRGADTKLASQASAFTLHGFHLIPSYHGVISLVFTGWPQSAMNVKRALDIDIVPYMSASFDGTAGGVLVREGGGSKFPKTSLGALCDDCTLTRSEYTTLLSICNKWSSILAKEKFAVDVDSVSIVFLKDRILDQRDILQTVRLHKKDRTSSTTNDLNAKSKNFVNRVVGEAVLPFVSPAEGSTDSLDGYLRKVNQQGNRITHYTETVAGGGTAVAFWNPHVTSTFSIENATKLRHTADHFTPPLWLLEFQREVNAALPYKYQWFPPAALHVTLRGLIVMPTP
eukprot:m.797372 g.797372  ORF g.797372 m.797372 type:complete len:327 (+) comp23345_c1_seq47:246-1226(+)